MVVEYIGAHRDRIVEGRPLGVEPICEVLTESGVRIAPSTYYAAKTRPPSARGVADANLGPYPRILDTGCDYAAVGSVAARRAS